MKYSIFIVVGIILLFLYSAPGFKPMPQITASVNSWVLNQAGIENSVISNIIVIDGFYNVSVSAECSGIILILIFILTIHALPFLSNKQKVSSFVLIPVLFLGNIIRLLMSILVGVYSTKEAMVFVHNSFGQVFLYIWAIGMYIVWLKVMKLFPRDSFDKNLSEVS